MEAADLYVLSDLHLGEGKPRGRHRWAPTEDFFHDEALARFLDKVKADHADDPTRATLVLNGDVFDFLTVTSFPDDEEAALRGFEVSPSERKFGLNPTEAKSVYKLEVIARGHPAFFEALSRFVAAGHRVEMTRGNHDLEIFFPAVRQKVLDLLARVEGGASREELDRLVRFHQLFYLEPGRVLIEHGHQYESTNSVRYPLCPILGRKNWLSTDPEKDELLDYPLGSIFVRFFYNRVRRIDPYAPRLLSPEQYMDFVRRYNVFDVWKILKNHYPHFISALGPQTTTGSARSTQEEEKRHRRRLEEAEEAGETGDLLKRWNDAKVIPKSASKFAVVRGTAAPVIRRMAWFAVFAFVALNIWLLLFHLIQKVPAIAANVFLTALFGVATAAGLAWAWINLRRKTRGRRPADVVGCIEGAGKVARIAKVPLVLMGHTHQVDHQVLDEDGAQYANSGTWTSVDNPWNRIMRDARHLTLLRVAGSEVEILRWNDEAARLDGVPLFRLDDDEPADEPA